MQAIVKYKCDEIQLKTTNNKNLTYTDITSTCKHNFYPTFKRLIYLWNVHHFI